MTPMHFGQWLESSSTELYNSTVRAFPRTRFRQHATDPIDIVRLEWTPYLGVKTLFVSSLAQNTDKGSEYHPMILFRGVRFGQPDTGLVEILSGDERYAFERLSQAGTSVLVRCDCPDFRWRFNYYDWVDHSLYGNKRKKYEGKGGLAANPFEMPGMCKHLIKLFKVLDNVGVFER